MNALVVAMISLSLVAGCDGSARNQQKTEARSAVATDSATLSSTSRVQSLTIPEQAQGAVKFRLVVSGVHNPERVPVELTITLGASRDTVAIGSVALFPPDSGGVFAVRLPEVARAVISRSLRERESRRMLIRLSDVRGGVALTVKIEGWER